MYKPSKRAIAAILALGVAGFGAGVWVLLHPASVFVQPWRAVQQQTAADHVLIGPYPVEEDFIRLKKEGVTRIVSLLEPKVPYEAKLLEQERERAARYGIEVVNFPMGSILGQKFGDHYARNAEGAARAAIETKGVAYIHCYLGVHRAVNVQKRLAELSSKETRFVGPGSADPAVRMAERKAYDAYEADKYEEALAEIAKLTEKAPRMLRLEGWSHYYLQHMPEAEAAFKQAIAAEPTNTSSLNGLGYSSLRQKKFAEAQDAFTRSLALSADDVSALEGLGFTHFQQSQFADARRFLERAVALNPDNPETRDVLRKIQETPGAVPNASSKQ